MSEDYRAWRFQKFIGVFCEAELIHLECNHLEIHLYQLFLELVCSTDLFEVDTSSSVWCVIERYGVSLVHGCLEYWWNRCTTILLNSFSMNMVSRLAIIVSC